MFGQRYFGHRYFGPRYFGPPPSPASATQAPIAVAGGGTTVPAWTASERPESGQLEVDGELHGAALRRWTTNECALALFRTAVIDDPNDPNCGWAYLVTLNPVRGDPSVGGPVHGLAFNNKERCHDWCGGYFMGDDGFWRFLVRYGPDLAVRFEDHGALYLSSDDGDDAACEEGWLCGVIAMKTPTRYVGFLHARAEACQDIT